MELFTSLLALDHPDWTLPWAGIGAVLLGLGSALSGAAALITARRKGRNESCAAANTGTGNGNGGRVSGDDSV